MPTSLTGTPSMPSIPAIASWGMSACPYRHAESAQAPRIPPCPRACPACRTQDRQYGHASPFPFRTGDHQTSGVHQSRPHDTPAAPVSARTAELHCGVRTVADRGYLIGISPAHPHIPTSTPNMHRCHHEASMPPGRHHLHVNNHQTSTGTGMLSPSSR